MGSDRKQEGPNILVVDDEPIVRRMVRKCLEPFECRSVHEAEDGASAKAVLTEHPVDIVITDLRMPDISGLDLMSWARQYCSGPTWIILSGLETFGAAVDAMHLGAFDFLSKPVQPDELRMSVRNALEQRRLSAERRRLHTELQESNTRLREKVHQLETVCRMLEDQAETISRDLHRAEMIQRALLPGVPSELPGYCVDSIYRPGRKVGGDLYDIAKVQDRYLVLYVADAAGHGVSAAMLSVLFKQRLRMVDRETGEPCEPARALEAVNEPLLREVAAPGLFVTAVYCLLDTEQGELLIAAAGHPPLVMRRAGGETLTVERTGPALGLFERPVFEQKRFTVEPGDRLLLYTDGLLGAGREPSVTTEEMSRLLDAGDDTGRQLLQRLLTEAADEERGDRDDVTMVLLQARSGPSTFDNGSNRTRDESLAVDTRGDAVLWGESEDSTYFHIRGRGTWLQSEAFHEATCAALDAGRSLTLDFSSCDYLDSTFLGTIHEIVDRTRITSSGIRLQEVGPQLRSALEELSMRTVLENVSEDVHSLPRKMRPLRQHNFDLDRSRLRLLRAHEVLASLSPENRDQFLDVVESLRRDLGKG